MKTSHSLGKQSHMDPEAGVASPYTSHRPTLPYHSDPWKHSSLSTHSPKMLLGVVSTGGGYEASWVLEEEENKEEIRLRDGKAR